MKKRVLIIGATGGIGSAIARELQREYKLTLTGSTKYTVGISKKTLNDDWAVLNVRDEKAIKEFFKKKGMYDAVIYCAGYAKPDAVSVLRSDDLDYHFNVNVKGAFLVGKYSQPHINRGGKYVFIASSSGMQPRPGWAAYAASKAALINFTQSYAAEMSHYGIKVFCVSLGRTATTLRRVLAPAEDPNTIMQPEDVAKLIHFLLTDAGGVLSSYPIRVHGGLW